MISLSVVDILSFLLLAARWTVLLSIIAFIGGGIGALLLLLLRYARPGVGVRIMNLYVEILQGTPLLLQLFLVFFGLPLLGIDVSPILAEARRRKGGAIDPIAVYRASGYRRRKAEERPASGTAAAGIV